MPYEIQYDPGAPRAVAVYRGHLSGEEVAQSYEDMLSRLPETLSRLSVIQDASACKSVVLTKEDIWRIVRAIKLAQQRAPQGRSAYVAGVNHPSTLAVVRLLMKLTSSSRRERRVFTDYDSAVAWLDEGDTGANEQPRR